jgi:hypothetical protein
MGQSWNFAKAIYVCLRTDSAAARVQSQCSIGTGLGGRHVQQSSAGQTFRHAAAPFADVLTLMRHAAENQPTIISY